MKKRGHRKAKLDDLGDALSRAVARVMGLPVAPLEKKRHAWKGTLGGRRTSTAHSRYDGGADGALDNGVRVLEQ